MHAYDGRGCAMIEGMLLDQVSNCIVTGVANWTGGLDYW